MSDPVRMRDPRSKATKELRELLAAGRSEMPRAERLRWVASRLGFPAAASPGAPSELLAKGAATGLRLAGVTKIGALVVILGAGTGVLAIRHRTVPVTAAPMPIATSTAEAAPSAPPSVNLAQPVAPMAPMPASASLRGPTTRARVTHPASAATTSAPAAANASTDAVITVVAPPDAGAPATWGSGVVLVSEAPGDAGAAVPAGPVEEAQRELASNPSRALYLALRDERSSGGLVEERDVVIIDALVRLGRTDEARVRASRFLRVYPASEHRAHIAAPFGFDPGRQNP